MDIKFSFDRKEYAAGEEFYDKDRVVLPDCTVLDVVNGWLESQPPQPRGLRVAGAWVGTQDEVAQKANAAIAKAV